MRRAFGFAVNHEDPGALGSFPALESLSRERAQHRARAGVLDAMRKLDPQSLTDHVDRLYRAAWALCGSREDAEDLVQETFARVLSRPRTLHGDDDLYYLMRVLRNTFLTGRRTASRRPVTVAELEDVVTPDPRPMGRPEQAYEVQEVYGTIAELSENFRLALVAVDVLGLSYREAARALRVREATLTTRLFRARKQVAARLAPALEEDQTPAHTTSPPAARAGPGQTARADSRERQRMGAPRREETGADGVFSSEGNQ
jgi:RNA polymerase sigma-70 factor, ECF subfamily